MFAFAMCGCATSMFFVYKILVACVHTVQNEDQRIHTKWDKCVIYLSFSIHNSRICSAFEFGGCWVWRLLQIMNSPECRTWWSQPASQHYCCVWQLLRCWWIQMGTGDVKLPCRESEFEYANTVGSNIATSHHEIVCERFGPKLKLRFSFRKCFKSNKYWWSIHQRLDAGRSFYFHFILRVWVEWLHFVDFQAVAL